MNKEEIVKLIEIKELQLKEITKQLTKEIDRIAFPHTPCDSFILILISIYILLVIIKDYFSLHLPAKPAIFDLSRSSPKIS